MPKVRKPLLFSCLVCTKRFSTATSQHQCERKHRDAAQARQVILPLTNSELEEEKRNVRTIIAAELQKKKRGPARAEMPMSARDFLSVFGSVGNLSTQRNGNFSALLLGEQITNTLNICLGEGFPRWASLTKPTSTRHVGIIDEGADHEFKIRLIKKNIVDHHTNPPTISFQHHLVLNFFIVAL